MACLWWFLRFSDLFAFRLVMPAEVQCRFDRAFDHRQRRWQMEYAFAAEPSSAGFDQRIRSIERYTRLQRCFHRVQPYMVFAISLPYPNLSSSNQAHSTCNAYSVHAIFHQSLSVLLEPGEESQQLVLPMIFRPAQIGEPVVIGFVCARDASLCLQRKLSFASSTISLLSSIYLCKPTSPKLSCWSRLLSTTSFPS